MANLDKKYWDDVGESSPYWGVLSHEKYAGLELDPDLKREFFATADDEIQHIMSSFSKISESFAPETALDFGCGVGRLSIPMSKIATHVSGVDVSASMLLIAEGNAREADVKNIDFSLEIPNKKYDWINSYIVFQHINPRLGYSIIEHLMDSLSESAFISIHITIYRDRRVLFRGIQESDAGRYDGENYISFSRNELRDMPIYEYDLSRVMYEINKSGFRNLLITHTDHGGIHGAFIFGARNAKA